MIRSRARLALFLLAVALAAPGFASAQDGAATGEKKSEEKAPALAGKDFLLTADEIDIRLVDGAMEILNARTNVKMVMEGDKAAAGNGASAPVANQVAPKDGKPVPRKGFTSQNLTLFSGKLDMKMGDGDISELIATVDVKVVMDELNIDGVRLVYDGQSKWMKTWGDETRQCVVVKGGVTSRCQEFWFNTETNESKIFGGGISNSGDKSKTGGEPSEGVETEMENILIKGADMKVEQNAETGGQTVTVTGSETRRASIGSKKDPAKEGAATPAPKPADPKKPATGTKPKGAK